MSLSARAPWREDFRDLFDLAGQDWKPPAYIRSWTNQARDKATFEARFRQPDGTPVRMTTKAERDAGGQWFAVEQHFDIRLTFQNPHAPQEP